MEFGMLAVNSMLEFLAEDWSQHGMNFMNLFGECTHKFAKDSTRCGSVFLVKRVWQISIKLRNFLSKVEIKISVIQITIYARWLYSTKK